MLNRMLRPQGRQANRNGGRRDWYRIGNVEEGVAEVFIYDIIGRDFWGDGVDAREFVGELNEINASTINLRINSPGGFVDDGVAIFNALDRHPARIETFIDGLAASSASWVGLAGERVVMSKHSKMMIHNSWTVIAGNAQDLQKESEIMALYDADIADMYVAKAGGTRQEWLARMTDETWFSDEGAVEAGLADEVAGTAAAKNAINRDALSLFKNTPDDLLERLDNGGKPSIRDAEQALRDAGFSRSDAKAVASRGWEALDGPRDADGPSLDDVLAAINASTPREN